VAYSLGTLSAAVQSALLADKPMMVPTNLAEFPQTAAQWRTAGSWASGSDDTATGYGGRRAYDRFPNSQTKGTTAGTTFYLIFDMHTTAATVGDAGTFDTVAILNHNLGTLLGAGETAAVSVEISDNSNFSSAYEVANRTNITTDKRLIWWSLGVPEGTTYKTITGARYARVKITTSASIAAPSIGQVIFGRRYQMSQRSNVPYDDEQYQSTVVDFRSQGGVVSRYKRNSGGRVFEPSWNPTGSDGFGLDDVTTLRSWFKNCDYGSRPFLFIDKPYSERETAFTSVTRAGHYVVADPALNMVASGPTLREAGFRFDEVAPFLSGES